MSTTTTRDPNQTRGALTEKVLEFNRRLQRLVVEAKNYDVLPEDFTTPLEEMVDIASYRRCSQDFETLAGAGEWRASVEHDYTQSDIVDWDSWKEAFRGWVSTAALWEYTVLRVSEFTIDTLPGMVYLELEERGGFNGRTDSTWFNTVSLFEFSPAGKISTLHRGVADTALRAWPISNPSTRYAATHPTPAPESRSTGEFAPGELLQVAQVYNDTIQRVALEGTGLAAVSEEFWGPLEVLVDPVEFRRCSQDYANIMDDDDIASHGYDAAPLRSNMLDWEEWKAAAAPWVQSKQAWEYTTMRMTEFRSPGFPGYVYCELQERGGDPGQQSGITWGNTILLFQFTDERKLGILRLGVADTGLRTWPLVHASTSGKATD